MALGDDSLAPLRLATFAPQLAAIGGVEMHLVQALRELANRGVAIDLLYDQSGPLAERFSSYATLHHTGQVRYSDQPLSDLRRIGPAIARTVALRPDVLYLNNLTELPWAVAVRRLTGAPIVCHLHELAEFHPATIGFLGARAARFIVASEYMRGQWSARGIPSARTVTIPYGIDPADYPAATAERRAAARAHLGLSADAFVALYMGRLDPEKGVEVLLDGWRQLGWTSEEAQLLIVGSPVLADDPAAYLATLQDRGSDNCVWLPMRSDVTEVLHAADVVVVPSVWEEPFGRVVIEPMSTGIPVIASVSGGIPETLSGDFARFLFARGDAAQLAQRLTEVRPWRAEEPQLGQACIAHAQGKYALTATVSALEQTLRDAVARR